MGRALIWAAAVAACLVLTASAGAQHGPLTDHLLGTGAFGKVEFVGKLRVHDAAPGIISDVSALGNYAYLGHYVQDTCAGPEGQVTDGGVYVVDISNPSSPREVGFIPAHQDTYVAEGVQALHIDTAKFDGDVLVQSNEGCGKNYKAGVSLWNITNPLKPMKLSENFGDFTAPDGVRNTPHDANDTHSAFAWDAGDRAYVVSVDDLESSVRDVDISDITDPKHPILIRETGLADWPGAQTPLAHGQTTFFHDVVVKKIEGHWLMLLSYWDAGWIILNVDDPANPVFVNDFDYSDPDPLTGVSPAEGNAHQAEFTRDGSMFIGTDEDFDPFRTDFTITTGPNVGTYDAGEFSWTVPISQLPDGILNGPTVYGGYGCPDDTAQIPPPSVLGALGPGEEAILVLQRGPLQDPNHPHDACFFSQKVEDAQNAGYGGVIIANHHVGSGAGTRPDAILCGSKGHEFTPTIPAVCLGHRAFHLLFNTTPTYAVPYAPAGTAGYTEPAIGTLGAKVSAKEVFDGWGYVHLIDTKTLTELDTFAIPEALDPAFASGFGALSVHEVATDPDTNVAYLSYYAGGFRAIKYSASDGIEQIGGYLDPRGNDFWGVEVWKQPGTGNKYILGSDRDSGLWIFKLKK